MRSHNGSMGNVETPQVSCDTKVLDWRVTHVTLLFFSYYKKFFSTMGR